MDNKDEMMSVVNFFVRYANVVKVLLILLGTMAITIGFAAASDTDGISLVIGTPVGLSLIVFGIFASNNFKWKAYMLQNSIEINENSR